MFFSRTRKLLSRLISLVIIIVVLYVLGVFLEAGKLQENCPEESNNCRKIISILIYLPDKVVELAGKIGFDRSTELKQGLREVNKVSEDLQKTKETAETIKKGVDLVSPPDEEKGDGEDQ